MSPSVTHIYLMPGMAAKPTIFEKLDLDITLYCTHWLSWISPQKDEPLKAYAKRMAKFIKHDNVVLIGVSFGGILVQEMQPYVKVKKLIIISSIKNREELPKHFKWVETIKAYKLIPNTPLSSLSTFFKFAFNKKISKRTSLYETYMEVPDKTYLSWAVQQVVKWENENPSPKLIHIHGTDDAVFPIQNIKNCIPVDKGTHIMILNKYKWFNKNLPKLIEGVSANSL